MKLLLSHGFSLLEMLVALMLFAVAMAVLLHLFPIAQRMRRDAQQNTSATFIAQRIVETLQATIPEGLIATAPDWIKNPSHCTRIALDQSSQHYFAYDGQDQPCRELTVSEYETSLREEEISSVASITTTAEGQPPGMIRVTAIIGTPANLPNRERQHVEFSLLLSTFTKREVNSAR